MSPLTDFNISFENRQELKVVEDMVLDLQVILPGLLDSITGVHNQCVNDFNTSTYKQNEKYQIEAIIGELSEYIQEAKFYIERAKTLKDKARSTAQLVRCLLQT